MAPAVNWTFRAELVRVIDGDTLEIRIDTGFGDTHRERIRLLGVDAPEVVGATRAAGLETARRLAEFLRGRELVVVTEMERVDGFRRFLGTVWADGTNINQWLVAEGLATVWRRA